MPEHTKPARPVARIFLVVAVTALALAYWRQLDETHKIRIENEQLRLLLDSSNLNAQAKGTDDTVLDASEKSPVSESQTVNQSIEDERLDTENYLNLVMTPTGMAPAPRSDGLALTDTTSIATVGGGHRAVLKFDPTISGPMGVIAVVVRLPVAGASRIVDLTPGGNMKYSDLASRISEDGKFAFFQISAELIEDFEVGLTVTEPVTADVRGTCGIGPYDVKIGDGSAVAVSK